jgi:uncharacterized repeat protein (TIGR02543 family)
VDVVLNGGDPQAASMTGTGFTAGLTLIAGSNTIETTATDPVGNFATVNRTVIFDDQQPSLAVTNPAADITTDQATLTLTGTASDLLTAVNVTVTVDGQTYTPVLNGDTFSQEVNFTTPKSYAIVVTATDGAGITTTVQRNVIYQPHPQITVQAAPAGVSFIVDGVTYALPKTFDWLVGSQHTIGITTPQMRGDGTWVAFTNWSDGGDLTHQITVLATSATYTANFIDQTYNVTFVTGGNGTIGGAASQMVNKGANASAVTAIPGTGYRFVNWTGDNGFVTTAANPLTVTNVTTPYRITANFALNAACGAPSSLTVPATNSTGVVFVSWGASNVSGATYVLERSYNGGAYTQVYAGTAQGINLAVAASGTYNFRVKATKSGFAESAYRTGTTSCTVALACGAPTSLTVPATNSTWTFFISWGASNVSGATYVLERSYNGGAYTPVYSGTGQAINHAATANGTYNFRVKATKSGYAESGYRAAAVGCVVSKP